MAAYTAIDDSEARFQCKLYTGTGSSQAITLDGDTDMQPDIVWIKNRSTSDSHNLYDAIRGVQDIIYPDSTAAEYTNSGGLTAFGSDGFTVNTDNEVNKSSSSHVAWCWKANGSGSSNTDGSINTAATSVDTTSGVSINTFTGSGSAATIGHGLGAVPKFIISKETGGSNAWYVYHVANGNTHGLRLSSNDAKEDDATLWNDTTPTSTVYSVGSNTGTNDRTEMGSYVFTDVQGFSKFGSYTGNGNADGPFVPLTFRPAWVLLKRTDSTSNWSLHDNRRTGSTKGSTIGKANPMELLLHPDLSNGEANVSDGGYSIDGLANGFKIRSSSANINASGGTYIYAAFADAPLVNSNGVPCNAM